MSVNPAFVRVFISRSPEQAGCESRADLVSSLQEP
jgi:hypothetical protein